MLSDLGPLREMAGADGVRARLFEPGNAIGLADVLEDLLSDPQQRVELGRRARLWTIDERDWKRIGATAKDAAEKGKTNLYSQESSGSKSVRLSEVRVGIIADPFTTAGLEPEVDLVILRPETWKNQLEETPVDVLFVESAWEGNEGSWRGKVGYYDDESFGNLRSLLEHCRRNHVPTIFWNKEDPVHFNRFRTTAAHFDHVFTSDDGSISAYLSHAGDHLKSVASLPFYAQPKIHNPLSGKRDYSHTVAYAGSYYGDRYKKRSKQLQQLLSAAIPYGLSIYDRQHLNPESPYKFPAELSPYVRGGLTYAETVDAYKSHPVHINVNSVEDSGTMFSRRLFEIAACGGAVVSGPAFGIRKMFGGIIPTAEDKGTASILIQYWMENERARNADAWLAMRSIFRSHTAGHRLAYALRTAGLRVLAPQLEAYAVATKRMTAETLHQLENQSVRPALVLVAEPWEGQLETSLNIRVSDDHEGAVRESNLSLVGVLPASDLDRTFFEDLLTSRKYCEWQNVRYAPYDDVDTIASLTEIDEINLKCVGGGMYALNQESGKPSLQLIRALTSKQRDDRPVTVGTTTSGRAVKKNVLVAGHDLKFAQGIITELESQGHTVLIDRWQGHSEHDEEVSRRLLAESDIIFCEWTLGNAVWYSRNKLPNQRLVTRLHLQEINTKYLTQIAKSAVDRFIFVGQHIADIAFRDFGLPVSKSAVVPNYVPVDRLRRDKTDDARFNIGIVGTVPQRKRLDVALDVLEMLRKQDGRYKLFVKGKNATDYPWMKDRPEEMAFYEEQDRRISADPLLNDAVFFDGHGEDMDKWYEKIGTVLSVSDFESFHLTIADGAASGAVPATLAWDGADQIYPSGWIHASVPEMVEAIISRTLTDELWRQAGAAASRQAETSFDQRHVLPELVSQILGTKTNQE
ncbi:glycosyltransferase [Arthrobacter sp. ATA002]|uniref:glycosyltransferase family protein n=1 Tax=Arthrobacter sp. ATA002 TaxID=2991715 RepID=UPI0022A7FEDB|nr:glycosyltransferase [Arthrobacter sp. ATA002]WAP52910.1 glycosyltransferase [Arthrobacter sp. ATA002]